MDFPRKLWYVFVLPKGGQHMNDYMIALLDRFGIASPREAELTGRVRTAEENLRGEMTKEQRKLLLRLTDSQNVLREEAVLYGFISDYRLAEGIRGELDAHPPFSIVAEDEKRARMIFEMERGEDHSETPDER